MILSFLKHTNSKRLILIFTGWGTGPELYTGLDIPGWDVAVAFKINNDRFDSTKLSQYDTIYLFAWSLGVYMADRLLDPERITRAFAINGTVTPVSNDTGIPVAIFEGTARNLNPANLTKFRRRTMPDAATFRAIFPEDPSPVMASCLARELENVIGWTSGADSEHHPRLRWDRAYISQSDRIFPPQNMERAWRGCGTETISMEGAHFIDIPALIRSVIADTSVVSSRFAKAADTYDSHALPQQMIALRLASLLRQHLPASPRRVLEIGPGTGFLTREWSRFMHPEHADFVDLTDVGPFHTAPSESYAVTDAEEWIATKAADTTSPKYDVILSSSVIQWFADILVFIQNASRLLRSDGIMAVSTFLPGNLSELDVLRPAPLLYPDVESLTMALHKAGLKSLFIEQNEIRMEFASRRHLLMHLKHTGVAGSQTNGTRLSPSADFSKLTYLPVYIIASKGHCN